MTNGLSDDQLKALEDLMRQVIREEAATKEDLEEKTKHLPTKDEFYAETAKIYKKLEDIEEEKDVLSHQVSRNSDRLDRVEKHTGLPAFE